MSKIKTMPLAALIALLAVACASETKEKNDNAGQSAAQSSAGPDGTADPSDGATGGACTVPVPMGNADCDACMEQSCCGEMDACAADESCITPLRCANDCVVEAESDQEFDDCMTACFGGPETPPGIETIFVCMDNHCVEACYSG